MPALAFPSDFPPTDRWKRFFIGVRWLGPDLSFFKRLKLEQANRQESSMNAWHGGRREELARAISQVLAEQLNWKSPYFLPEDMAEVAFHGPSFDFTDPEAAFDAVVEMLGTRFSITPSEQFWRQQAKATMGQLVDRLLGESAA